MTISTSVLRSLLQKSGNRCAFPGCPELLTLNETETDETIILSNVAHIVARSKDGPRGQFSLPLDQRDLENNLILLCTKHHLEVDNNPYTFSVERLRGFKEIHEQLIQNATAFVKNKSVGVSKPYVNEKIYSTLFEVIKSPVYIYFSRPIDNAFVSGKFDDIEVNSDIILPYIYKEGSILTFQNPMEENNPFHNLVDKKTVTQVSCRKIWEDTIKVNWYVELVNKAIRIFMEQKDFQWDDDHKRYFFAPDAPGETKDIIYRPLNQKEDKKHVVWRPITKKTGLAKSYWLHRALNIRFIRVTPTQWCVSLRPEFRVTSDGLKTIPSRKIGAKITKKKSRMFNYDLLGEINFWRSILSNNEPRIILNFGNSSLLISSTMLSGDIAWPGIPEKFTKSFSNVEYAEDLFTWHKLQQLQEEDIDMDDFDDEDGGLDE